MSGTCDMRALIQHTDDRSSPTCSQERTIQTTRRDCTGPCKGRRRKYEKRGSDAGGAQNATVRPYI